METPIRRSPAETVLVLLRRPTCLAVLVISTCAGVGLAHFLPDWAFGGAVAMWSGLVTWPLALARSAAIYRRLADAGELTIRPPERVLLAKVPRPGPESLRTLRRQTVLQTASLITAGMAMLALAVVAAIGPGEDPASLWTLLVCGLGLGGCCLLGCAIAVSPRALRAARAVQEQIGAGASPRTHARIAVLEYDEPVLERADGERLQLGHGDRAIWRLAEDDEVVVDGDWQPGATVAVSLGDTVIWGRLRKAD